MYFPIEAKVEKLIMYVGHYMKLGEIYEPNICCQYVRFIPSYDGTYVLTVKAPEDTYVYICEETDEGRKEINYEETVSETGDMCITADYKKDSTYLFEIVNTNQYPISSMLLECETHTGTVQSCYGYICEACGGYYGEALNHDWSNKDGICARENCDYECPHNLDEGTLTRPTKTEEGYYTYSCSICNATKTEAVERDDYTEFNKAITQLKSYLDMANMLVGARRELEAFIYIIDKDENYGYIKGEESEVNKLTSVTNGLIEDVEEAIVDGTALKADYTAIDKTVAALEEKLADVNLTDEATAVFEEIKAELEAMKADENTSAANLADLEKALDEFEAEVDNCLDGTHNGLVYEVTEEAKCEKNAVEEGTCYICGEVLTREVEGTALARKDDDGDCKCDYGCGHEFEKPADPTPDTPDVPDEPDSPEEPEDEPCADCGKVYSDFFSEIICFFTRLINFIKNLFA